MESTGLNINIIYKVEGMIKLLASTTIAQRNKKGHGWLQLKQMSDVYYLYFVPDHEKFRRYKLDTRQFLEAKLVAKDGRLTIFLPVDGGTRCTLEKGDVKEIEEFMKCLDKIKIAVLTNSAKKNPKLKDYISNVPRVKTLYGSKEDEVVPSILLEWRNKQHSGSKKHHTTPPKKETLNNLAETNVIPVHEDRVPQGANDTTPLKIRDIKETPKKNLTNAMSEQNSHEKKRAQKKPKSQIDLDLIAHLQMIAKRNKKNVNDSSKENRIEGENFDKENTNNFCLSPSKNSPSSEKPDVSIASPTFETPKNKTPLKENLTSPKRCNSTSAKNFYGNDSRPAVMRRTAKRAKKSLWGYTSTPPPSKISKYSRPFTLQEPTNKSSNLKSRLTPATPLSSLDFDNTEDAFQGFTNLGNTCYMNAVLQSILSLDPFVQDLENHDIINAVDRYSFYKGLYNLFRCKNEDGGSLAKRNTLRRLKRLLSYSETTERFTGYQQHDAHEFMNLILIKMKEEVEDVLKEKSEDITVKVCPVKNNFEGRLKKYIECKNCSKVVSKEELFISLSLNIRNGPSTTLTDLVERFFQKEDVEGRCKCGGQITSHHHKITRMPRVIILHLQRCDFIGGSEEKISKEICANRFLDIERFCDEDVSPPTFTPKQPRKEISEEINSNKDTSSLDTKRRKIDDEDIEFKRALKISKLEHENQVEREEFERSQVEEAIRMSLEEVKYESNCKSYKLTDQRIQDILEAKMIGEETLCNDYTYELVSVVKHVGSSASVGHYISDVRDVKHNKWTRFDDVKSTKITEGMVRCDALSEGYLYFYIHKSCIG